MMKLVLSLTCALIPTATAQIFVDDFSDSGSHSGTSQTFTTYEAPGAIGGLRDLRIAQRDAPVESPSAVWGSGSLTFQQEVPTALVLSYGSQPGIGDASQHLHLDLSSWGGIEFNIISLSRPFEISLDAYSFTSSGGEVNHYYHGDTITVDQPGSYVMNVADLTGNADLSDIAGLQFGLGVPIFEPLEFTMGEMSLVPVPEPSTYAALFAVGLLGFGVYRKYHA